MLFDFNLLNCYPKYADVAKKKKKKKRMRISENKK